MLPRYRHRHSLIGAPERPRPRLLIRLVIGLLILLAAWYLVSKVLSLFDYSSGRRAAVLVSVRSGSDNVQVSLQEGEWQRGETNLKLYAGDAIATRGAADAVLRFFDGSRVRLDQSTDVFIDTSDNVTDGTSSIELAVRSGRIWIATPTALAYSGSILRTVSFAGYKTNVPAATHAMLSAGTILVLRTSGAGQETTLTTVKGQPMIIVSEGQYFALSEEAKQAITNGSDPYDFRDPVTPEQLRDPFLTTSYALLSQPESSGGSVSSAPSDSADLTVSSPEDNAKIGTKTVKVAGKVSDRIQTLLVNGQEVDIAADHTFSVDVNVGVSTTMALKIEAQDAQGIVLATVDRVVTNEYKVTVEPVRIKSPVGSGETLTTSQTEVEITGEAPAATAAILVNDYKLMLYRSGGKTWSYLASAALGNLLPGKNVYTIVAVDADGNRSPARSITIDLTNGEAASSATSQPPLKQNPPLTPGVLKVTAPTDGSEATVAEKEVVIEGQTSADTSSISINGYTLSLYLAGKTTWNYIASTDLQTMRRGKNVYRIVARNAGGEILDILEYTINYKP